VVKSIEEVVEQLKRNPSQPVRAILGGVAVEVRTVAAQPSSGSAAELFATIGPWAGESGEQILALLSDARRQGGRRSVADL
jgi:hypothetical protein